MGWKLYPCKVYQIEIDNNHSLHFYDQKEEFNRMIYSECQWQTSIMGDTVETADLIEVDRNDLANLIAVFADPNKGEKMRKKYGLTAKREDIIHSLAVFLACADRRNDFVALRWI